MWSRAKFFLLPFFGALAAIVSFQLAAPYAASLAHPGLASTDPATKFTVGTMWGQVQRLTFGTSLCGSFCFLLTAGRQSLFKVVRATLVGTVLGGLVNYLTDSGSDVIGIACARANSLLGEFAASTAWSVLVPAGIAFTLALALGPTKERLKRAVVSTIVASVTCYGAMFAVQIFATPHLASQGLEGLVSPEGNINLEAMLPVWRSQAIAVGVALGMAMAVADQFVRAGTIRLLLGRNEFREWSLDHNLNRIGASEGLEIPVWGFQRVAKLHGQIIQQGGQFVFQAIAQPALLNNAPVQNAYLHHGDTILLGDASFVFLGRGLQGTATVPQTSTREFGAAFPPSPRHVLVDQRGGHYPLTEGANVVGREDGSAIHLPHDATVSRRHAAITVAAQETQVSDLGSSNGTRVNGVPLTGPAILRPGDAVEFGSAKFTFR